MAAATRRSPPPRGPLDQCKAPKHTYNPENPLGLDKVRISKTTNGVGRKCCQIVLTFEEGRRYSFLEQTVDKTNCNISKIRELGMFFRSVQNEVDVHFHMYLGGHLAYRDRPKSNSDWVVVDPNKVDPNKKEDSNDITEKEKNEYHDVVALLVGANQTALQRVCGLFNEIFDTKRFVP
ncbi:MAG TPA: hypothetical protein VLE89_07730 [Chlamydiales bacterium]|nr:hypothetical protein [Chlamydiales bacterium]